MRPSALKLGTVWAQTETPKGDPFGTQQAREIVRPRVLWVSPCSRTRKCRCPGHRFDLRSMQVKMKAHKGEPLIRIPWPGNGMRRNYILGIEAFKPSRQGFQQRLVTPEGHDPIAQRATATRPRDLGSLLSLPPR
jgi:hypothetical protein